MGLITADAVILVLTMIFPTGEIAQMVGVQENMAQCITTHSTMTKEADRIAKMEDLMDEDDIEEHWSLMAAACMTIKVPLNGKQA